MRRRLKDTIKDVTDVKEYLRLAAHRSYVGSDIFVQVSDINRNWMLEKLIKALKDLRQLRRRGRAIYARRKS